MPKGHLESSGYWDMAHSRQIFFEKAYIFKSTIDYSSEQFYYKGLMKLNIFKTDIVFNNLQMNRHVMNGYLLAIKL